VLPMVTLSLIAMSGVLGLAVDLGWMYFVKKSAQAAVDASVLAAATKVLEGVGEEGPWTCGAGMTCQEATPCPASIPRPPSSDIEVACLYASENGFDSGGRGGRQQVVVTSGVGPAAPDVSGVKVNYWIRATAAERIPQLFSAVLGNTVGTSSARATAGVVDSIVPGSLILLNRENDCLPMGNENSSVCGVDVLIQANDNQGLHALQAEGGIMMASAKDGTGADARFAGENTGGGAVTAPFTYIRGSGNYTLSGGASWTAQPENGKPDTRYFTDPLRGKGQPPPPRGLADRPVLGGMLSGSDDPSNPLVVQPGNYYSMAMDGQGQPYATGEPIRLQGSLEFSDGGTGFGSYAFFGGVTNQSAGTTIVFGPGSYFFVGAKPQANKPSALFDISVNMTLKDKTTGYDTPVNAGEIFVFTDPNYHGGPDGTATLEIPPLVQTIAPQLRQGMSGFQSGNSSSVFINLHGLNREHESLPREMKLYAPVVLWQDQANSIIKYTGRGQIDTSCGQPECPNTALWSSASTELVFQASPNLHLWGVSYQPRGSWTSMLGGGGYDAPLQLITGALKVHANSNVRLRPLNLPLVRTVIALIE
jgi:putative Flp pilus-assembly TadE/G-like protein